jgi:hypothetical protein
VRTNSQYHYCNLLCTTSSSEAVCAQADDGGRWLAPQRIHEYGVDAGTPSWAMAEASIDHSCNLEPARPGDEEGEEEAWI